MFTFRRPTFRFAGNKLEHLELQKIFDASPIFDLDDRTVYTLL
jgi:hypothetical protein